jgi:TolA-binding protein
MKTKFIIRLFLSFLMLSPVVIFAQERKDKVETMHIAYLSQKLNLTSGEAEKFWPIYNQYKADQDQLRKQRMANVEAVENAGGVDNMSDAQVQKLLAGETDLESRELDLRKQYLAKFQQAIPVRKVAKFFIAEDEFKRYLLNELRKRR